LIIIPAIDIKDGKCVRLVQGQEKRETVYSEDPVSVAKKWVEMGAKRLHVVDLDGAFTGHPKNLDKILAIKKETGAFIELGGGFRTSSLVEKTLKTGIDRVILGTVVFQEPNLAKELFGHFREKLIVALDVKEGKVGIQGWTEEAGLTTQKALSHIEELGCEEIIFTDIAHDHRDLSRAQSGFPL
jgi:phosphoribosylformimino-5-aminoimidazole carboxamide ribotide isomerase